MQKIFFLSTGMYREREFKKKSPYCDLQKELSPRRDSNPRPQAYEACAITTMLHGRPSRWRDSNSRPSAYKADAITTMLHRRWLIVIWVICIEYSLRWTQYQFLKIVQVEWVEISSKKKSSPTGSWTRVSRVKAEYPDHLDYRGVHMLSTGIEPATLGLWDPRAANCATKAVVVVVVWFHNSTLSFWYQFKKFLAVWREEKKSTLGGARTHDHKIKSLALYHLSYEGHLWWREFSVLIVSKTMLFHLEWTEFFYSCCYVPRWPSGLRRST